MRQKILYPLILFCLAFAENVVSREDIQANQQQGEVIVLDDVASNAKREEVQRYFGFDENLTNYLTLPYDVSANVNEKGKFVEVGYWMFALLPLILLFHFRRNRAAFYAIMAVLIIYLCFGLSHASMYDKELKEQSYSNNNWSEYYSKPGKGADKVLLTNINQAAGMIARPFTALVKNVSGEADSVTYPILIGIYLILLFFTYRSKRIKPKEKFIFIVLLSYSFFWLILSGGIVWYAFLVIPLSLLIIGMAYSNEANDPMSKSLRKVIPVALFFWFVFISILRISNITLAKQIGEEHLGKSIVEANLLYYTTGVLDADQTLDNSFKNLSVALKKMNTNEDLIYIVGTSFRFDIKNSATRLFPDNTLSSFLQLLRMYPDKNTLIAALKASNFRYIIVDLYTDTLDQTPEKSLTQKYKLLLNALYQNPSVSLIATDRMTEFTDANGNPQRIYNVFGGNIVHRGGYAIYEIL